MKTQKYRVTVSIPFVYLVDALDEENAKDCAIERAQNEIDEGIAGVIDGDTCNFEIVPVRNDSV